MASGKQGTEKSSVLSDKDKFEKSADSEKLSHMGEKTEQNQSTKSSREEEKK